MKTASLLHTGLERLGLALSPEIESQLVRYLEELVKWNRKMNLVGAATEAELIERHFLDSLTLLPLLERPLPPDLLDIGSGAGFPGLVLKIALPEMAVTLVEPRSKRAAFLRHVIRTLGLRQVEVVEARLPTTGSPLPRPRYHLVTSRALSDLPAFLALAALYSAPGGRVICMKGSRGAAELEEWRARQDRTFRLIETREWRLPFSDAGRMLLIFRKEGNGPEPPGQKGPPDPTGPTCQPA